MSVQVTVERVAIPGVQREITSLLRELLSRAVQQSGFQSAETVVDIFSPTAFLTISRWTTLNAWQAWERTPDRLRIIERINALLQRPPTIRLWNEDPDAPPPAA